MQKQSHNKSVDQSIRQWTLQKLKFPNISIA